LKTRSISILGSTGSIGSQALQVVDSNPGRFKISALCAHGNLALLFDQVRKYRPEMAGISSGEVPVPDDLRFCEWRFGPEALEAAAGEAPCQDVLVAVVGIAGLKSVLSARKSKKRVLLANKEALVAGGRLVMNICPHDEADPTLIPVDSEHSAIYQCLLAARDNPYEKIILTASGGPFRSWTAERMRSAALGDALNHPTWRMGRKITVDSASMFNKALEIIEARWLFDAEPGQIEVLVHPESIIHSMVCFRDGAVLAQLGLPDMKVPIAFAMSYPERLLSDGPRLQLGQMGTMHFEKPDLARFPALRLSYQALRAGGAACCILNAANEVSAEAFLQGRIGFRQIAEIVEATLSRLGTRPAESLDDVLDADMAARGTADRLISEGSTEGL